MAILRLTPTSSYAFSDVRGSHDSNGAIVIAMGTTTLTLTQEEWRQIRIDVEHGVALDSKIHENGGH